MIKQEVRSKEVHKIILTEIQFKYNDEKLNSNHDINIIIDVIEYSEQITRVYDFAIASMISKIRKEDYNSIPNITKLKHAIQENIIMLDERFKDKLFYSTESEEDEGITKLVLGIRNVHVSSEFKIIVSFESSANYATLEKCLNKIQSELASKVMFKK